MKKLTPHVIMKNKYTIPVTVVAYTIIRNDEQYMNYCKQLEKLTRKYDKSPSDELLDIIDTITLLIDLYDKE